MSDNNKPLVKTLYGDLQGQERINFDNRLDALKIKYAEFLTNNNIDFDDCYEFVMRKTEIYFSINNQSVIDSELSKEMRQAFSESFTLSNKG